MAQVSIIVPTCDRPELLRRALDSIRAQSFADFEVIVVDDGETPEAEQVVASLQDMRIRTVRHAPGRQGGSKARNTGIKEAGTDLIAFLDDDDTWEAGKLEQQVAAMSSVGADVGFCVTGALVESEREQHVNHVEEGVQDFSTIALIRLNGFLTSSLMVRREVFETAGYFDEAFPSHQEAELMIRISRIYKGVGIDAPLVRMNMFEHEHIGGSLTRRIAGRLLLLQKHNDRFTDRPDLLARHHFTLGLWYRDSGQYLEARASFLRAWALHKRVRYLLHASLQPVLARFSDKQKEAR